MGSLTDEFGPIFKNLFSWMQLAAEQNLANL